MHHVVPPRGPLFIHAEPMNGFPSYPLAKVEVACFLSRGTCHGMFSFNISTSQFCSRSRLDLRLILSDPCISHYVLKAELGIGVLQQKPISVA